MTQICDGICDGGGRQKKRIAQSNFDIASPCKVAIQSTEVVEDYGIILKISPINIPVEPHL